jgi:hypothetical protein
VSQRTVQSFEGGQKVPHCNGIAAMRRAIEMAGILFRFGETGDAAGIVRQSAYDDPCPLVFEKKGERCWHTSSTPGWLDTQSVKRSPTNYPGMDSSNAFAA